MSSPRIRIRRTGLGLTQAELAARAGVSRQLVAAVEAGRNVPSVDAALRLARALDTTAEALFAPDPPEVAEPVLEVPLPDGALLRLGRVGGRLVAAELPDHGAAGSGWARPDAAVSGGTIRILPGAAPAATVIAGCDPALGLAAAMLDGSGPHSLLAVHASTGRALEALARGTVHGITVHERAAALPPAPVPVERRHLARWQVGIALPGAHAGSGLAEVLDGPVIQREPEASSQQAFLRALAAAGADLPPGPVARGHLDAARMAVLTGMCAVTAAPAAAAFGLLLLPLEEHTVELWIDARRVAAPGVSELLALIAGDGFAERLRAFGGYDLTPGGGPG